MSVMSDDWEPAILIPEHHECLKLVPQTLNGIVMLDVDHRDIALSLLRGSVEG